MDEPRPLRWPFQLMTARPTAALPEGTRWAFEPKFDGFRAALLVGASGAVRLYSRAGRPLGPYFPEIVIEASALPAGTILDGELVVPRGGGVDFAAVQRRIHPSPKRVAKLARLHPAALVVFDLLELEGRNLQGDPYDLRRACLVRLLASGSAHIGVMPMTPDTSAAIAWLVDQPQGVEGCVAKRRDQLYRSKVRGWRKIRTPGDSSGRHRRDAGHQTIATTWFRPVPPLSARSISTEVDLLVPTRAVPAVEPPPGKLSAWPRRSPRFPTNG